MQALEIGVIGLPIIDCGSGLHRFSHVEVHPEGRNNCGGQLVLEGEYVCEFAIIGLGPQVIAVGNIDKLGGNAQAGAGLAHRSLQHRIHLEGVANFGDVQVLAFEGEGGCASGHL